MTPSLFSFDTGYCADSVEFCPHPQLKDILVCGTYQLDQANDAGNEEASTPHHQRRLGRCYVFKSNEAGCLLEQQRFDLPAILDMKWSHTNGKDSLEPLLAIADAKGRVSFHRWSSPLERLVAHQTLEISDPQVLCLSLDWANRRLASTSDSLIVSLSNGSLSYVTHASTGEYKASQSWHAHDFEPWIAAWDYWHPQIAFSGGDDCKLKGWDVRQGGSQPTFVNNRFEGGVTTIQANPHIEHLVAVGSYDETVRLFDVRKVSSPLVQAEIGGGAWRVKWHPSSGRAGDLLVACMHDGFKVLRCVGFEAEVLPESTGLSFQTVQRFDKHQSLAYGVDWSCLEGSPDHTLVASCSFYDHALHTWWSNDPASP